MLFKIPPKHLSANYSTILKVFKIKCGGHVFETFFVSGKSSNMESPIYIIQKYGASISRILLGYLPSPVANGLPVSGFDGETFSYISRWHFHREPLMGIVPFDLGMFGATGNILKTVEVLDGGTRVRTIYYQCDDKIFVAQKSPDQKIHNIALGEGKEFIDRFISKFTSPYIANNNPGDWVLHVDAPINFAEVRA
jgi:hypothetical protein